MAYVRRDVKDGVTIMNKDLYDNLQDGIDEVKQGLDGIQIKKAPVTQSDNFFTVDVNDLEVNALYYLPKSEITYRHLKLIGTKANGTSLTITTLHGFSGLFGLVQLTDTIRHLRFIGDSSTSDYNNTVFTIHTDSNDVFSRSSTRYNVHYIGVANEKTYTPSKDYHPATKKYVDDMVNKAPIILEADKAEEYETEIGAQTTGDLVYDAIMNRGKQVLVRVPNADGGKHTAIYSPIYMYQMPNYQNNYMYLFYLTDEKQTLDLSALGMGTIQLPVYGELKMKLNQYKVN